MSTMLIAFNGTRENGQFPGDQICSIKAAYLLAQNAPAGTDKFIIALSPGNDMHFLWQKFIDDYSCEIVYDAWNPGDMNMRFEHWDRWRRERQIEGRPFDHYRELYRRIDGAQRQNPLCGGENGLGRRNIFEYFYYGQENFRYGVPAPECPLGAHFDDSLIYRPQVGAADRGVLIAPHAKCQGNHVFTFAYWERVVRRLVDGNVPVTVNYNGNFCEELNGHPCYRKIFPDIKGLVEEVCRHRLVSCGNTGVGWIAAACGVPLFAMEPPNSVMQDYRYAECGVQSLVEVLDTPDSDYCARRIVEEVDRVVVFTTGCYDVLHTGHIRHLEESRSLGTKLIVALNSDASVKSLKGDDRPHNDQAARAAVLAAVRYVDRVEIFDGADALPLIKKLRPDVITNGPDHKLTEIVGKDFVESYGGRAVITGGERTISSTRLISRVRRAADVSRAIREACTHSVNPEGKMRLLAEQVMAVESLPGDFVDIGTYRGGCAKLIHQLAPDRELHCFDTWTGCPVDDPLSHHRRGEWAISLDECRANVGGSERVHYYAGVFPDTFEAVADRRFSLVFCDPDAYSSVRDAIAFFWPRLVPGGRMLFDDYDWPACAGVKKAVDEAFEDKTVFPQQYAALVVKN